jgi:hypothetical protein
MNKGKKAVNRKSGRVKDAKRIVKKAAAKATKKK